MALRMGSSAVTAERRADGSIIVKAPLDLPAYPRAMTDRLDHWATVAPDRPFLVQRDAAGTWREVTYAGARALARNIAQGLIDRRLTPDRPVAILSGNGLEHAIIGLGAMYAGVPFASISPAYSLVARDFDKLKYVLDLVTPGLVFATNGTQFARAIAAAVPADTEVVVLDAPIPDRKTTLLSTLWATPATSAVDAAHAKIGPDTIAKLLFTSGSTGTPKGVINTQRMLTANQVMIELAFPSFGSTPPVLVDWLPWSHTFGGNHNFNLVLMNGGTLYIDDGKPLPGAIEETVRNLREIAPTVYFNVPKGFEMLLPYLQAEPALRQRFFSRLQALFYAGAALPAYVAAALEKLALETTGTRIPMITSLGSTETAPAALAVTEKSLVPGSIGIPQVGCMMKLVPNAGKLEGRLKGPHITPGYWRQPDMTAKVFDEEGYYMLGDAFKFVDAERSRERLPVRWPRRRGLQAADRHLGQRRPAARPLHRAVRPARARCRDRRPGPRGGHRARGARPRCHARVGNRARCESRARRGARSRGGARQDEGAARDIQRAGTRQLGADRPSDPARRAAVARHRRDDRQGLDQPARGAATACRPRRRALRRRRFATRHRLTRQPRSAQLSRAFFRCCTTLARSAACCSGVHVRKPSPVLKPSLPSLTSFSR